MKFEFRSTTPSDLPGISVLLQQAFAVGPDSSFLRPDVMNWKYWDRREDYSAQRSFVLERDGRIVCHGGIWPMLFGNEATGVRGCQIIDWAAAPDLPGAGLAIVRKVAERFDFIHAIGGTEVTRNVLPAFGYDECTAVWKAARPLRPLHQALSHQDRSWKLVPRFVRNAVWASSPRADTFGWRAEQIAPHEVRDDLVTTDMNKTWFSQRTSAFFEFYLRCPIMKFQLYQARDAKDLEGYFVLGLVRGQAKLAGIWLREPDPDRLQAVYACAQRVARNMGANEIVTMGSVGASGDAAVRSGFRPRGTDPVFILNKKKRLVLPQNFQFQLCDDDEAFLDDGQARYWT